MKENQECTSGDYLLKMILKVHIFLCMCDCVCVCQREREESTLKKKQMFLLVVVYIIEKQFDEWQFFAS